MASRCAEPIPDILESLKGRTNAVITAFALETHNGEKEAIRKMKEKNVNSIIVLTSSGIPWDRKEKYDEFDSIC